MKNRFMHFFKGQPAGWKFCWLSWQLNRKIGAINIFHYLQNLEAYNLTQDWKATSYSTDILGTRFIASIENNRYVILILDNIIIT